MAAQTENRFCYSCGEYLEDSDRFCVKCGCKRKLLDDSTSGTKKSKSLNEYVKEKGNERGGFFKAKFQLSKNDNKDLKKSRKPPNLRSEVLINVGLIETNEKGAVAVKTGSWLATKVLKLFGLTEVAHAAVRKHADHDQFFCGSDDYVLWYSDKKIVQFIPGSNKEFTVELYKEEIGKPYSKIDLFLCNVSNVDDAVDRKLVEDKKVSKERSCIGTSPIFKPSNIVADLHKQNANNYECEFANILPSLLFPSTPLQNTENIQPSSISLQRIDNIQGFLQPPSRYQEEPSCSRDFFSPSNGRKVFCPICNNAFSINTIEEHADLCLESKTKFFFEKHTESSDEGELLDIAQNLSETKGNYVFSSLILSNIE